MELKNINNPKFVNLGLEVLQNNDELLVMVRYPFGDKNFIIINSEDDFLLFLKRRKKKESITLFKSFQVVYHGIVNEKFIEEVNRLASDNFSFNWISLDEQRREEDYGNWCFIGDLKELKEELEEAYSKHITIILEPDWLNEEIIYHGYIPDEDGVVRPGSY